MKALIFVAALILAVAGAASSQEQVWDFASARSSLGWKANGSFASCKPGSEGLVCVTKGHDPQIEVANLSLTASYRQFIEIEVAGERQEDWQVFWANSAQGQYGGYDAKKSAFFTVVPGGSGKYRIFPFWGREGKILKLRLDPPDGGGTRFVLKAVRVLDIRSAPLAASAAWRFGGADNGWTEAANVRVIAKDAAGWNLAASGPRPLLLSPMLDVPADENLWLSVTLAAAGGDSAILHWATDEESGLRSASFPIKPDGRPHVYNLDMSAQEGWEGHIIALGFGPPAAQGASVVLKSVSAGSERGGGPEITLTGLGLDNPMVRAGKSARISVRIANTGGAPTGPVKIALTRPTTLNVSSPLEGTVGSLAPGEDVSHTWTAASPVPSSETLTVTATAQTSAPAAAKATVRWHPALPAGVPAQSDYVPPPSPAPTGAYTVGCYYFPGWHTYDRWAVLNDFPERRPLLGYYREGDPEVADWHAKWALEHGINFFAFDWYWSAGSRSLDHALHNGFFKSRYFRQMKFCLLWANHNPPGTSSYADMEAVTRYWIDNYFKRPEYLRLDNKPVVIIFSTGRFTDDMGVEGTRKALDRSRELCRQAGLNGVYFVACTYPQVSVIKNLEMQGYDALTGYNYPSAGDRGNLVAPYDDNVTGYQEFWDQIYRASTIPYIPVTDPGWDSRPWHGPSARVRTGKDPAKFATMLRNAKAFVDTPGRRLPDGKKVVLVEAWNEFGEGDYVEPTAGFGFGFIDAVRDVFSTAPRAHTDIVPADVGRGPYEIERPPATTSWEFVDVSQQYSSQNMRDVNARDGVLAGTATNHDPAIYLGPCSLDTRRLRCVEIRMRLSAGREAQLFWANSSGAYSEPKSTRFKVTPDGQFHVYRVDLSSVARWSGTVRSLRLDMTDASGASIAIDYVRVLEACP